MKRIVVTATLATFVLSSQIAFANTHKRHHRHHHHHSMQQTQAATDTTVVATQATDYKMMGALPPAFVPSWYVGGNMGVSYVHDNKASGTSNSVTQAGPGWSVDLGYQFLDFHNLLVAGELGYTQYHASNETTATTNVASTEHFAAYLAAVGEYPLVYHFGIVGKLGVAYSYAKKVFTATAASRSSNTYSVYYGAGLAYHVTSNAAFLFQWDRARGDSKTGSTDLTSLGLVYTLT